MTTNTLQEYAQANPKWAEDHAYTLRQHRDVLLAGVFWKVERHQRELRLGLPTTDSAETMLAIDQYIQELCNVPQQAGFPHTIIWPVVPN